MVMLVTSTTNAVKGHNKVQLSYIIAKLIAISLVNGMGLKSLLSAGNVKIFNCSYQPPFDCKLLFDSGL